MYDKMHAWDSIYSYSDRGREKAYNGKSAYIEIIKIGIEVQSQDLDPNPIQLKSTPSTLSDS
jgi:hypothetical protein